MTRALYALGDYKPKISLIPEVRLLLQELIRLKGLEEPLDETNVECPT